MATLKDLLVTGNSRTIGSLYTTNGIISSNKLEVNERTAGDTPTRMSLTQGMPSGYGYNEGKRGTCIWSNAISFTDPYYQDTTGNDSGWIRHIETSANSGYLEIATGDDPDSPIIVRQYNTSNGITHEAYLLNSDGNTTFPGSIYEGGTALSSKYLGINAKAGSAGSADTAGYATNAGDADTLDGNHASAFLTSHQTVTDKDVTLAWSTQKTIATIGSTDIHVTLPANPDTWRPKADWNAASGADSEILNKPTIPTVNNSTITIKQTGISDQTFTLNGSAATISLVDTNTWRGIQDNLTSSTNTTESLSAKQGYLLANGSARDDTKVPTTRTVNGKALSSDITLNASDVGAVATDTKTTAGGDNTSSKLFLVGMTSQTTSGGYNTTYSNSNVYATNGALSATSFNATSSRKAKKDIVPTSITAIDIINDTEIVDFKFKDDEDQVPHVGFIAEDTDPLLSTPNQDKMDYTNCIGVLLKAVQELSAKVEYLEKKLEEK